MYIYSGDFRGMAKLTILLSIIHILPLSLVWLLPDTREEQRALRDGREKSNLGGTVLLSTIVVSIFFTVLVDMYFVFNE